MGVDKTPSQPKTPTPDLLERVGLPLDRLHTNPHFYPSEEGS